MHSSVRTRALTGALVGMLALAAAGPAAATQFEALNPYLVSGAKANADALARAGYDLLEGGSKGGKIGIVATERQAQSLREKGLTVTAPMGRAASLAAAPTLEDPTHGWDVYRPWNLTPAPCPGTCSTPLKSLKQYYDEIAAAHPDLIERVVYGRAQYTGQELVAYRVTDRVRSRSRKPTVLYDAVQHAREWIAAETARHLFTYVVDHSTDATSAIPAILADRELWFAPMVNPDGYDFTFASKATRLWRKNLRDVDGDGQITTVDGVDPNRNWPVKWGWDEEGANFDSTTETYRGESPASESEVSALEALTKRLRPKFQIDYHSFGDLILYPEGWQVETTATDGPLLEALAGDDDNPAIPGYDPDVSAELYTVNGDVTDNSLTKFGTQAYTVELSGGSGPPVGGTQDDDNSFAPSGFVFQDSEADVQKVFEDNLAFALDLANSAKDPDDPVSHLGNSAPDLVPSAFDVSHGDPQVVEVNAKKALGRVTVSWQVNGGRVRTGDTREYRGGKRFGEPGAYYHRMRGTVRGAKPGDQVKVWFKARSSTSEPFTYTLASDSGAKVLVMAAEDYSGPSPNPEPYAGPLYLDSYTAALQANGVTYDVWDVDALNRTAPSALGVLSHYRAVIWYTGEDLYTREPTQPGGTGVSKLLDDEVLAARAYLNDGGKLLVTGKTALQGAWDAFLYNPLGAPPGPFCASNQTQGNGDADDPPGQEANCVAVSNDFQQYWLGAYLPIGAAADPDAAAALGLMGAGAPYGSTAFTLNGADSAQNQDNVYSFLTTSSVLPVAKYPQFESHKAIAIDRPASFDPPTGSSYMFSQADNDAYKRLSKTVDLAARTSAALEFKVSYDTEPEWDFVFVEARTVGGDDWTTLPDTNGNTTQDTGLSCPGFPFPDVHPQLAHYMTYTGPPGGSGDPADCQPVGTTGTPPGVWNAATGNSGGFQTWNVDLSAYAGKQVELSISYVSDVAVQGLGVFVDDAKITADGATLEETSFETPDLGGWTVPGAPAGSPDNVRDWIQSGSVGYEDGPGVATDATLYWGFGLEGVSEAGKRAALLCDALRYLGASGSCSTAAAIRAAAPSLRARRAAASAARR